MKKFHSWLTHWQFEMQVGQNPTLPQVPKESTSNFAWAITHRKSPSTITGRITTKSAENYFPGNL
jgi:hypothetical protein